VRTTPDIPGGALSLSYLDYFPDPSPRTNRTHAELCHELGISFQLLDRTYVGLDCHALGPTNGFGRRTWR
jgi:hypothetical protein